MTLILEPTTTVPLRTDANGVIRVGTSRVTLETLLHVWQQGSSPEEIVEAFPVLHLDDVMFTRWLLTFCGIQTI